MRDGLTEIWRGSVWLTHPGVLKVEAAHLSPTSPPSISPSTSTSSDKCPIRRFNKVRPGSTQHESGDSNSESTNRTSEDKTANLAKWWLLEAVRGIPQMVYGIGVVGIVGVVAASCFYVWSLAIRRGRRGCGNGRYGSSADICRVAAQGNRNGRVWSSRVIIWTIVILFILLLIVLFAFFAYSLFFGGIVSSSAPQKQIDESFGDFVKEARRRLTRGRRLLPVLSSTTRSGRFTGRTALFLRSCLRRGPIVSPK